MAYFAIEDSKAGMDLRKSVATAPAGTYRLLQDGHITPGAEIKERSAPNSSNGAFSRAG